jgi:hypothetical protein
MSTNTKSKVISRSVIDGKLVIVWEKTCVRCRKTYQTSSAKQKYCSSDCCSKAQGTKRRVRKERSLEESAHRLKSRAYALAKEVAELYCPKPVGIPEEDLRVHHKDLNPFNNSPENLLWMFHQDHELLHAKLPRVNIIKYLSSVSSEEGQRKLSQDRDSYLSEVLSSEVKS